ncbi:hypothetical protein LEAN103870_17075 [Legionella anisa]|uniref:Protein IcmL-like protein n=1 Tax=Legionella anisa TaxID=28082 RepID=A0AAX0WWQ9_9GAMM|nr:hypothetical protein [Legionella anisa]AWN72479.1 hypothetical protein DLD14_00655 [Legionella anisa]KTC72354.1 hypothetical protein Lani_1274 [Legionella anisa]MBN5935568.1 hypothetical protein [Legionella anisa]MCW8423243.1 hypothetical protein [Legionella anisa]MCW8446761.1 hypothetical protein [Legionella anisa]
MKTSKVYLILSGLMILVSVTAHCMTEHVAQAESDAARIFMLEKALAPQKLDEVATLFAKANKERNGAVQFMLFSDQLKNKYKDSWPAWVSGVSSPWITAYEIKKTAQSKNSWKFKITYQWATASGPFDPPLVQTIVVTPVPQNTNSSQKFWITSFNEQ